MNLAQPLRVASPDLDWTRRTEAAQLTAIWRNQQRQTLVIVVVVIAAVVAVVTLQTPASLMTRLLPPPWPALAGLALVGIGLTLWSRAQARRLRLELSRDDMRSLVILATDRATETS